MLLTQNPDGFPLSFCLSHTYMHRPAHMHTICSHTLLSKWQLVFSNSRTWPTICACAQIMHVFITCDRPSTLSRVLYLCLCIAHVRVHVHVCAQAPKWNSAPERDWNQYFLLHHLSHLYKAETIWTPVYSTLASFIKLPHLAKTDTHTDTHGLYKVPQTFCYKYRKHTRNIKNILPFVTDYWPALLAVRKISDIMYTKQLWMKLSKNL